MATIDDPNIDTMKGDFTHVSLDVTFLIASKGDPRNEVTRGYTIRELDAHVFRKHPFHIDFDETLLPFLLLSGAIDWNIQPRVPIVTQRSFNHPDPPPIEVSLRISAVFGQPIRDHQTSHPITGSPKAYFQAFLDSWDTVQSYSLDIQQISSPSKSTFVQVRGHVFSHPLTRYWRRVDQFRDFDWIRRDFVRFFQETGAVDCEWVTVEHVMPNQEQLAFLQEQLYYEEVYASPQRYQWLQTSFDIIFRGGSFTNPCTQIRWSPGESLDDFLKNALEAYFGEEICFPALEISRMAGIGSLVELYLPHIQQFDFQKIQFLPDPLDEIAECEGGELFQGLPRTKDIEQFLFRSNCWNPQINIRRIDEPEEIERIQREVEHYPMIGTQAIRHRHYKSFIERHLPKGLMKHAWEVTVSALFLNDRLRDWVTGALIIDVRQYFQKFCEWYIPIGVPDYTFEFFDYCLSKFPEATIVYSPHDTVIQRKIAYKPSNRYDPKLWYAKGRSLERFGKYEAAIQAYERAAEYWELADRIERTMTVERLNTWEKIRPVLLGARRTKKDAELVRKLLEQGWQ